MMRRREFITLLGGAAAWPIAARAQQPSMPVIGYLSGGSPEPYASLVTAFRKGLSEMGYVEGRNVAIEYRWAQNENARLPELASDLVHRQVAVIATPFSSQGALTAKALTATIPIVFYTTNDPVQAGLVASLNRPGSNVTGVASMGVEIEGKQVGLLHELVPQAARFAVLMNPTAGGAESTIKQMQSAGSAIGRQIEVLSASTNSEIDSAFASLMQKRADALLISSSNLFVSRRVQLTTLATHHKLPTIYPYREFTDIGGLMSYGMNTADAYRQAGIYTGRILKGEKPADLPVMQATKFEFVINLQTARTLGIEIPPTLLALATEVIE
jgi:putative ABC transport system substrate-binding protein